MRTIPFILTLPLLSRRYLSLIALIFILGCNNRKLYVVKPDRISVTSMDDILPLTDTLVRPVLYDNIPNLSSLPVKTIKSKFIAATLPAILIAKHQAKSDQTKIKWLLEKKWWTKEDSTFYLSFKEHFRAEDPADLITRMETLPTSIILAQAAIESGWGQSRFFREGNNMFGVWAYNKNEKRMPAKIKRNGKTIYLRKYSDLTESVLDYFQSLARARVYAELRTAMQETCDPFALIPHLKFYSEQRTVYTKKLRKMIEHNDLIRFDKYKIDPAFLAEE